MPFAPTVQPDEYRPARLVPDEGSQVVSLHHRGFYIRVLRLLIGIESVRPLRREPGQHLAKLSLVRPVAQNEHGLRIDAALYEKVVELHDTPPVSPVIARPASMR